MNKTNKSALGSLVGLIATIYLCIVAPTVGLVIGSGFIAQILGNWFEIGNYHNKKVYLTLSTVILILGLISGCIYAFNSDYIQSMNKIVFYIIAVFLTGSSFYLVFNRANNWKKSK